MAVIETLFVVVLLALIALMWWQTKRRRRWGLGTITGTNCPRCSTQLPAIRKPNSMPEMMWGGFTCPKCGCKIDKYGREIVSQ